jgi:hypothetical protein
VSDQRLRDLLELALDPAAPLVDRRNAITLLETNLDELARALGREVTPNEQP